MVDDGKAEKKPRSTSIYVKWIAIGVGVFMVMVGGMLLLWGFSYQATVGEPRDLDGDDLTGGPILIPAGAASMAFGALWLFYGIKGFKRPGEELGMKVCPNCGKQIEEDLNFCYHCTSTFCSPEEEKRTRSKEENGEEEEETCEEEETGPSPGQIARTRRQRERRSNIEGAVNSTGRKAEPLAGMEKGDKGR
jgi:hypothetical protein